MPCSLSAGVGKQTHAGKQAHAGKRHKNMLAAGMMARMPACVRAIMPAHHSGKLPLLLAHKHVLPALLLDGQLALKVLHLPLAEE